MSGICYLSVPEVIGLHARTMRAMGWAPAPLRSEDLLESAVMKAQAAAYYGGADLAMQAVTLAVGISQNQPFLDGNKRTAHVAMRTFLLRNGWQIGAPSVDVAKQLIAVAEREGSLEEATEAFAAWLRERLVTRP
jgi:death-on-curing protein